MKCIICNTEIEKSRYSHKVICSTECFTVDYWNDYANRSNDKRSVRVNHVHYWILPDRPNKNDCGFGGRQHKIVFNDGREIITCNLWHQGNIPESFYDKLPDNARFETAPQDIFMGLAMKILTDKT